jgi:hypothetical protein
MYNYYIEQKQIQTAEKKQKEEKESSTYKIRRKSMFLLL